MTDKKCPICFDVINLDDRKYYPCPCGFQTCFWCYSKVRTLNNQCPKCRRTYMEENLYRRESLSTSPSTLTEDDQGKGSSSDVEDASMSSSSSTSSVRKAVFAKGGSSSRSANKSKASFLKDVRVVRRDLCYLVGLPLEAVADETKLKDFEFFGKYGKVVNIIVNRNPNFKCPDKRRSCAVYVTFTSREDAKCAIIDLDESLFEGRKLRASYGTTKYCSNYLRGQRCSNKSCFYLHEKGAEEDSFTVDQLNVVKEKSRDLTCSAILSEELNQLRKATTAYGNPNGGALFGRTREETVAYIVKQLPQDKVYRSAAELPYVLPSVREEVWSAVQKRQTPAAAPAESGPRLHQGAPYRNALLRASARPAAAIHPAPTYSVGAPQVVWIPEPPLVCNGTVHPALQREWGMAPNSMNEGVAGLVWKKLVSPLTPTDGQVSPARLALNSPSRLIAQQGCVTPADLTATSGGRATVLPPGLY